MKLQTVPAKRCSTACGWLVHDEKVLLVMHHMLGIWLSPGGHIEQNELPHIAAEREFFEETGVRVRVVSAYPMLPTFQTEELPMPFYCNLHWINKPGESAKPRSNGEICEQHYIWGYFVEPIDSSKLHELDDSDDGVDDVRWFSKEEVKELEMVEDVRQEALYAIEHYPQK